MVSLEDDAKQEIYQMKLEQAKKEIMMSLLEIEKFQKRLDELKTKHDELVLKPIDDYVIRFDQDGGWHRGEL